MNQDPHRPWDSDNPPTAPQPPPEGLPSQIEMPPYPPSAGRLIEPYPVHPSAPMSYAPPSHPIGPDYLQPVVPQHFPQPVPPMLMVQQFHPGIGQVVVKRSFPHGLHLILTLITCGLWSPIWLIHYLLSDHS